MAQRQHNGECIQRTLRVHPHDLDPSGSLRLPTLMEWSDGLRWYFLQEILDVDHLSRFANGGTVERMGLEQLRPIRIDDQPIGQIQLSQVGLTRWTFAIEIYVAFQAIVVLEQSGVFLDRVTQRPLILPEPVRKAAMYRVRDEDLF